MANPPLLDSSADDPILTKIHQLRLARLEALKGKGGQKNGQKNGQAPRATAVDPSTVVKRAMPIGQADTGATMPATPAAAKPPLAKPADGTAPADGSSTPADGTTTPADGTTPAVTTGPATLDTKTSPLTANISGQPMLRGLAYGPNSEGATKADQGQLTGAWDQKLKEGDIAVSPNLQDRYPLRSYVDVVDKNGNVVLAKQFVADTSMIKDGVPTHNTFEVWNGKSLGEGYYLVPTTPPDYSAGASDSAAPTDQAAGTTASFAQGGVVTKPTLALVGEAGPEAIVPLSGGAFSNIASWPQKPGENGSRANDQASPRGMGGDGLQALSQWLKGATF